MAAGLGHAATVEHDDIVGVAHGGEAVRHYHHCAPAVESGEILHDGALVGGVERVGGFVEEDEVGVAVDGAGY